jgi:hypothetical protein
VRTATSLEQWWQRCLGATPSSNVSDRMARSRQPGAAADRDISALPPTSLRASAGRSVLPPAEASGSVGGIVVALVGTNSAADRRIGRSGIGRGNGCAVRSGRRTDASYRHPCEPSGR